jgi:hypothetical protein
MKTVQHSFMWSYLYKLFMFAFVVFVLASSLSAMLFYLFLWVLSPEWYCLCSFVNGQSLLMSFIIKTVKMILKKIYKSGERFRKNKDNMNPKRTVVLVPRPYCACPNIWWWFPSSYVMVLFIVFHDLTGMILSLFFC